MLWLLACFLKAFGSGILLVSAMICVWGWAKYIMWVLFVPYHIESVSSFCIVRFSIRRSVPLSIPWPVTWLHFRRWRLTVVHPSALFCFSTLQIPVLFIRLKSIVLQYVTTTSTPSILYLPLLSLAWVISSKLRTHDMSCESTAVSTRKSV